ncbi:Membrane alanine aminopeptidase [Granulibacter bethesdensis]|nr:Membrane alanine aminopeptidase [Granulibacter bethesdensis]
MKDTDIMSADASSAPSSTVAPVPVRLSDYTPPAYAVEQVDLVFRLDPARTVVQSRLHVIRQPGTPEGAVFHLDGEALELLSLRIDGREAGGGEYRLTPQGLDISGLPAESVLEIDTAIAPEQNTELSGLYVSQGAFFTQCEAEGFRRITYFPDRPDVMARYTTTIVAPRTVPVLLSNGNPVDAGEAEGGLHWAKWEDPHPKPCYLFALVAGDLAAVRDSFITRSGRRVALAIWVREGDQDRCAHAMDSLKRSMRWDEDVFGLEYDLDVFNIAAVSDFNMGAMENKGLNVFNTKYVLARPDTATDSDYQGIETVIAHEYFHNWTGNRVTCRDWFQLTLKEGLTVFRDQEFSADMGSRAVKRISDVRTLRAAQFREDAGPLAHPVRPETYIKIDNFYTATVYQKGAELVRMIRTLIGREKFRQGMDLYFQRHDNHAVTLEDFAAAMQDASGIDLSLFRRWYGQAGTPVLRITDEYDASAHRYVLHVTQYTPPTPGQEEKQPLLIPIAVGLLDETGAALSFRLEEEEKAHSDTRILRLEQETQSFVFHDVARAPQPSLLRDFSAPVKLADTPADRLRFLAAHDSDSFVRWDSGQQYATQKLLQQVAASRDGAAPSLDEGIMESVAASIARAPEDPALAAEAMALPAETTLADAMEVVDVEGIHAVRRTARAAIGQHLRAALRAGYEAWSTGDVTALDGRAMGGRAFRNACLGYLAAADDGKAGEGVTLAWKQFQANRCMTDVLAALSVLADTDVPEREQALVLFYDRWRGDALVLDKWFAIQAMSSRPDALEQVRRLISHPEFDWRNPNRVRAVLTSFASGNQVRFHDASGAGYAFLADAILHLDGINGQIAARMTAPLGAWRRQDQARAEMMQAQLRRIAARPNLSGNVREIVDRSLR